MLEPLPTIGPYEILASLGRGGMGVVYRARDRATGSLVAVKTVSVPNENFVASIRREIQALARIDHPGVVRIVGEAQPPSVGEDVLSVSANSPMGDALIKARVGDTVKVRALRGTMEFKIIEIVQ